MTSLAQSPILCLLCRIRPAGPRHTPGRICLTCYKKYTDELKAAYDAAAEK